ncbi:hypothetical protein [Allosphingosinicella deserti]|uniref:Uncharacterized protein n=1 Tax=Allosphingosinicella deserti TaxID=2116704 RepID=A0A2P7QED4_9SPHN|nr:hypothetical protein [Sphingomonas deserti]PSJ36337.1 hypothetical protein C7I55_26995 [Sphingomonas deserti]
MALRDIVFRPGFEVTMIHYRLYFLGPDGGFLRAEDVNVADDEAAIATARERDHAETVEVWERARLVAAVPTSKS